MQRQAPSQQVESLTAIVAHGLLTSMSVVSGGIQTVHERWYDLSSAERDDLVGRIVAHTAFVAEGLKAISKGLTEGAIAELETQRPRRRSTPTEIAPTGVDAD